MNKVYIVFLSCLVCFLTVFSSLQNIELRNAKAEITTLNKSMDYLTKENQEINKQIRIINQDINIINKGFENEN